MIANEIIPAGTCCIWCGEYDGAIVKNSGPPFFFNMAAISRKCQLCTIAMKIDILGYFDVANMMEI